MAATVSSLCPVCRTLIRVEPSTRFDDAPCPNCGVRLWLLRTSDGVRLYETNRIGAVRERAANIITRVLGASWEQSGRSASFHEDVGADALDMVEMVMELEEEFNITIPDFEAERIRTMGDLVDWLIRHLR